jgi:hypothetical protein
MQDSLDYVWCVYTWYRLLFLKQALSFGPTRVDYSVSLFCQKMETDQPLKCGRFFFFFQHELMCNVQNFSLDCDML